MAGSEVWGELRKKEKMDKSQQKGRIEPAEMLLAGAQYGEDSDSTL